MTPIREPNFSKKGSKYKFNGRYKAKNGMLMGVHNGIGHIIDVDAGRKVKGDITEDIEYDCNGDCVDSKLQGFGYYLVERVNPQSLEAQIKVEGCKECNE